MLFRKRQLSLMWIKLLKYWKPLAVIGLLISCTYTGWYFRGKVEEANYALQLERTIQTYERQIQEEREAFLLDEQERVKIITKFIEVEKDVPQVEIPADCNTVSDSYLSVFNKAVEAATSSP